MTDRLADDERWAQRNPVAKKRPYDQALAFAEAGDCTPLASTKSTA